MVELTPADGEREITDPELVGEWAEALRGLTASLAPPWGLYLARRDGAPVGIGLFKGAPDDDGWAEIAYLCFLPARGQGVASAIAGQLAAIASGQGATGVWAHTMAQSDASTRVLERNGFVLRGEVVDPDDGPVWRWDLPLAAGLSG